MKCGYTGCLGELSESRPARSSEVLSHNPETGEMFEGFEIAGDFYVRRCTRCGRNYQSLDNVHFYCGVAPTKVLAATIEDDDDI